MNAIDNWLIVNYFAETTKDETFAVIEKEAVVKKTKYARIRRNMTTIIPILLGIFNAIIK